MKNLLPEDLFISKEEYLRYRNDMNSPNARFKVHPKNLQNVFIQEERAYLEEELNRLELTVKVDRVFIIILTILVFILSAALIFGGA